MVNETDGSSVAAPVDAARLRVVEKAVEAWKGQLVDVGGRNTLLYYKDLKQGTLDLRANGASPATVDLLLGSHTVRISNLFPGGEDEDQAAGQRLTPLAAAAKRARTVRAKATENFEERGIETLFLAWGMATWTNQIGTATPAAPVLLRQASLIPLGTAGEDYELSLPGEWEVNPTLLHFLATEHQVKVTAMELLDLLADDDAGLPDDQPVFERLCKLAHDVPAFSVADRVVLGNFSYAKLPMVNDLEVALAGGQLASNELLAAIAGDGAAAEIVRGRHPGVQSDEPDMTPPADEFLVLDADASQSFAINTAVRGGDLVVEGPPGTGKSQTIANLISSLSARGKKVLFVAEKRAAIDAVLERLNGVGLGDLVLDLHDGAGSRKKVAQDLARALAAAESIPLTDHSESHQRLERRRESLRKWRDALHARREPWGISVYELQAELIGLRRTETVTSRLDRDVIGRLGGDAYRLAAPQLEDFAELGGLAVAVGSSPWRAAFDAHLVTSADQVTEARDAVAALATRTLPQTRAQLHRVADACGFHRPGTLSAWVDLIGLVEEVAVTLDGFDAAIFDEADALAADLAPAARGAAGRVAAAIGNGSYRRARKRVAELAGGRNDAAADMYAAVTAAT
ncbi:MAG: AAA domain-containing protein, partial [Acidimicrobiia bacterium]